MLYSETELKKRLKSGCPVFYFYASDEALVRSAAAKAEKFLSEEAPDTTTLDGPTPSVEDIVLAAGTISFFGGRRLVMLPLIRPSAYSDKDLQELCDTLSDTENAVFVLTSLLEEKYGKIKPGKREQKLIAACEKLGYCVQIAKPGRAALQEMARTWAGEYHTTFAPGAEAALLDRCGDDQFLLQNEIAKLAALSGAIEISGDAGFSDDIKRLYRDVYDEWERYDDLFLVFTNHNVIRSLGEKFIYLGAYIDADAYSDAYSTAKAIAGIIKEVKREKYPLLGNIF